MALPHSSMCYIHGDNDKDRRCDDRHESDDDKDCMSEMADLMVMMTKIVSLMTDMKMMMTKIVGLMTDLMVKSDDRLNGDDGLLAEVGSR